jgi:hypothetical protein
VLRGGAGGPSGRIIPTWKAARSFRTGTIRVNPTKSDQNYDMGSNWGVAAATPYRSNRIRPAFAEGFGAASPPTPRLRRGKPAFVKTSVVSRMRDMADKSAWQVRLRQATARPAYVNFGAASKVRSGQPHFRV